MTSSVSSTGNPTWDLFIACLNESVVPALGCTEPISTALATANAVALLGTRPERIDVQVSGNLMKNGMGVGVPGTGMIGLPIAAAIGALGGNPDRGLEVLADITPEQVANAKAMVDAGNVTVRVKDDAEILYSEVLAVADEHTARVIIKDHHTQITLMERDGEVVFEHTPEKSESCTDYSCLSIANIYDFACNAKNENIEFILQAAKLNGELSVEGLNHDYGLQIGKTLKENIEQGILSADLITLAMMRASAASDARMDGAMLPAMSNSGSGNQGISATMPVVAVAEHINATEEQLTRALIISHLTAIHIKKHLNILSAMCGATTAGMGAACGITYLLGGDQQQIENAIFNMVGDVSGIFCDGAKTCCSSKVSTSASAAVKSALMAMRNIRVRDFEGIIATDVEGTIDNLGRLGNDGMAETDRVILDIMTSKPVCV